MALTRRALLGLVCVAMIGCGDDDSPTGPTVVTGTAPYSQTDLVVGTGATAANGQRLTVNYTGWLYSNTAAENKGTQFDSSVGSTPFAFTLGAGQVIRGWDQGVPGMRVGGRRRLVLPPELAYGSAGGGNGRIPPNATLLFEVELLAIQ